ncbi:type II toxin-antitoxin system PemK/MazF family toxin [Acetobacter sp. LMG 1636]|uniref:Type II toxin-antitoxin system PemK/MazF family toxin n=1 Tax=Acetobacter fallax TaxID=1737473 RepID=A0ABX0KG84_9PROT|nr:type II toxin-antitoxin system PemK/MazF family toxin [Acetobacter fallax]NHO37537.1 type II toxin-antitoxin system PemK/MazF family toxin [Acetobacter fallax]
MRLHFTRIGERHVQKAKRKPAGLTPGQIVVADWRGDALPKEPNKRRPAVVVEETDLFAPGYPNVILVPITEDEDLAIPDLSVVIEPTNENGCSKRCVVVSHLVTTTSKARIKPTTSWITSEELAEVRQQIAMAIGLT